MWVVQFVATALILALRNADWKNLYLPQDFPIFTGKYSDFNVDWYSAVGSQIVLTCFINVIMPISNLVMWGINEC